ncbi:MAG: tryptophan synthase subunit alpha [Limnochordaceae bacterium]|nr:tryptophan synthase subunit alpha [Limnochordaceae bacterium]
MSTRVQQLFGRLRAEQEKALIGYLPVGDPDLDGSYHRCRAALEAGLDALELGVPYSDPLADGPVIQAAGSRALAAGFRLDWLWLQVERLRRDFPGPPLAVMTYINPVIQYGPESFVRHLAQAGADALIVPDLPGEESAELEAICRRYEVARIPFVAPTTPPERMRQILSQAEGFVYCVSVTGVTGQRQAEEWAAQAASVRHLVHSVRQAAAGLPVCLGFGIASGADVQRLAAEADGVIVGSALIMAAQEGRLPPLVAELKQATLPESRWKG